MINDTRQRIIEAARQLIYARSYADVGVAAICEQAGVKKGSFYHFFDSKQALTLVVLDTFYLELKQQLFERAFASDLAPLQRLERLVVLSYELQKEVANHSGIVLGCPFGNLAMELATQDEAIRGKIESIFARMQTALQQTLQDAVDIGELADINVNATAQAMLAYLEGVILLAKTHNDPDIIQTLLPAMLNIRIV